MTRVATLSIYSMVIALIIFGLSTPLFAQSGSIRLEGDVWDPSGNSIAGALLTAVEETTGRQSESASNSDGHYVFPALQPGVYTVTVKSKAFKDVVHRGIQLFSPGSVSESFSFEMSAIDREIEPSEQPRLSDSGNSAGLSRKEFDSYPMPNRDPLSLLIYQPGVQINTDAPGYSSVNGLRPAMNGIGMDGLSVTDPVQPHLDTALVLPGAEAISDIQIVTSGAKAEYGRSAGAQVTVVSRQGSKSWNGDLYDYFRHKTLDANDFFNNSSDIRRPAFTRNIFGGTISGPVTKNTRLLLNFEGNRTDQQVTRNRQVLTSEAKQGLFRWYTPGTGELKTYDIVANDPRHLGIDPAIASILARMPAANNNSLGDGLNIAGYKYNSPAYLDQQGITSRIDHTLNSNHQLFFRVNWNRFDGTDIANYADASFPGGKSGTQAGKLFGFVAGSDWTLNPRMINELRAGYTWVETELRRPARLTTPMYVANSWTNVEDTSFPRSYKTPVFEISDYFSQGTTFHTFKYGASYRRTVQGSVDYTGVYPNVTLGTSEGNDPTVGPSGVSFISNSARNVFENLYNDLLGRTESVSQTFYSNLTSVLPAGSPKRRDYSFQEFAGFIQDDWRIRPNFTLNLGLRYELSSVPREQNGYQSVLDQASQVAYSASIGNFQLTRGKDWYKKNLKDFAPRIGFAWDPTGAGSTVIRGAYGVYYDRLIGAVTSFIDQYSYGFKQTASLYPNAAGTDLRISDGISLPAQPDALPLQPEMTRSSSIAVFDQNIRTPRVDQFNLTIEKRMLGGVVELGYVGTRGKRLFQYVNLNQTKTSGDFLRSFKELQAYRSNGIPVSAENTLVKLFGSPLGALDAISGYVVDTGQIGIAADTVDRDYYGNFAAAGVSDFYIRNFPQFDSFMYGSSSSQSWYDAFQFSFRKSSRNSSLRLNYSWSKSLDTVSSDGNVYVSPSDSRNPGIDKAPSDFDRTHVLNLAWNYSLPLGRSRNNDADRPKWVDFLFGGWNIGTLWTWESGQRFSVNSGMQNRYGGVYSLANFDDSETDRNSLGKLYNLYGTLYWFNSDDAALFSYPEAGKSSDSGRNTFRGPRYFNVDCLLQKRFFVGENKAVQFRMEAFNLLNNTHLGLPNANLFSSGFGIISSTTGTPRRLQLALRYQF